MPTITAKQRDRATKKLFKKYGWEHHDSLCWDYGRIFRKRIKVSGVNEDTTLYVETQLNGVSIKTDGWCPFAPIITYAELKLFKKISDYYKEYYEHSCSIEIEGRK